MKKLFSGLLVIAMICTLTTSAFATDITAEPVDDPSVASLISADDFYALIGAEYAKYHIGFTAENYDPSTMYSLDTLNNVLEEIRTHMSSVSNYNEELGTYVEIIEPIPDNNPMPYAPMPYQKTYSKTETVQSPSGMGAADIYIETVVTIDALYNIFKSVDSMTTKQLGYALNFESWTQDSWESDVWIQLDASHMQSYATGTLVVSYTEPNTGIKLSYSSEHTLGGGASLYPIYID